MLPDANAETTTTETDTDTLLAQDDAYAVWCDEHRDAWIDAIDNDNDR